MLINIIIIVVLVGLSAAFSGSEIAFSSLQPSRLEAIDKEKSRSAQSAHKVYNNFESALLTILIGNNLVNIASSSIATVIGISLMGDQGAPVSAAVMTIVVLIFGEIVPKIYASNNPLFFSVLTAPFVEVCMFVFAIPIAIIKPIVNIFRRPEENDENEDSEDRIFTEELNSLIETVEQQGVIEEDDIDLLYSVVDFSDIPVSDVFTPRVDMYAIDIDDDIETIKLQIAESNYSRLPVYDKSIDKIIGILSLNRYYKKIVEDPQVDIRNILFDVVYVYKSMRLPTALNVFLESKSHLGIVTDEYGGTMGLVTLEDVMEFIVGDIWDESDTVERDIVENKDGTYSIDGDLALSEFADWLEWEKEDLESEAITVGGWCLEELDNYPSEGDQFEYQSLLLTISKVDNMRIERISVAFKNPDHIPD